MRGIAVPRAWAALEPHFPRASHSRPAHSSRGSKASTQLAFPRKPRFRALIFTHLRDAVPRIPLQMKATAPRISTRLETLVRRISMNL